MKLKIMCVDGADQVVRKIVQCDDMELRCLPGARVIRDGRSRLIVRVPDPRSSCNALYVKRYLPKRNTWRRRLGNLLHSRALFEYRQMLRLQECGLPVPAPVGAAEFSGRAGWEKDYVLMDEVSAARSIRDVAPRGQLASRTRARVRRLTAETLAKAHGNGFVHDDLGADNVLLREEGEKPLIYLIDMANSQFVRRVCIWHRIKNLAQLCRSLPREVSSRERLRFLLEYGRASGLPRQTLRAIARLVALHVQMKNAGKVTFRHRLRLRLECCRAMFGFQPVERWEV